VSSFTKLEQGRVIVEKYYKKTLYPMLKCRCKNRVHQNNIQGAGVCKPTFVAFGGLFF
jgi:hypothetical protein